MDTAGMFTSENYEEYQRNKLNNIFPRKENQP
jgi:hypothetical protein